MSCGYLNGGSCGSRFAGYPCAPAGPPRFDANNNIIPNRTVLCGTEVCTNIGQFRDYVLIGNVTSLLNPAVLDLYGDQNVYGTLTIAQNASPTGIGGLVLETGSTFNANCNLNLGTVFAPGDPVIIEGASVVMAKAADAGAPSRGGRLDVVYYDAAGATTATGFLYTSNLPSWYVANGTGLYYEEKIASALQQASDIVTLPATPALLTTTVLSTQGSNVVQQLQTSSGLFARAGNSTGSVWGLWVSYATYVAPP